jgi:hypothetical protein
MTIKVAHYAVERIHEEPGILWFDGNGCGPWVKSLRVEAHHVADSRDVMLGVAGEDLLPANPAIFGGAAMSPAQARAIARALLIAAERAEAL